MTTANKETLGFQAEVKQLLQLMIHSLYSNKEIFLRELVSNASDACDKLRFEAMSDAALYESDSELKIRVDFDKDARTVTITDNGIGMSRQEVIENVGTIARSGTRAFFENLTGDSKKDANLIGQFGVGFYSAFIVADRVTLITRRAGLTADHGVKWESTGEGEFTLENVDKAERGTQVILHLREGEEEFANDWRLKSILRKYSDHITLPIVMTKSPGYDKDGNITPAEGDETVNQASALWARAKNDISEEQYKEFYKHVAHDFEDPLAWSHARVEGRQEYTELLYIPQRAPFDMWDRERRHGVKLYVRRVFIMEDADKLLPHYLRFVRGVIDSSDLPLNVSREILQHSKDIDGIRAGCTKKVLDLLSQMAENEQDKFATFWKEFGQVFKEGVGEDHGNKEKIAKLCRFASTHADTDEQIVSLDDYISRMKEGQDKIYYITGDTFAAAKNSPHLEVFRKKGVEVLLLSDRVDEWLTSNLFDYAGKTLASVAKGDLDLGKLEDEAEKEEQKKAADDYKALTDKIKDVLGERVKEVRITHRLTESASCVVVEEHAMSGHLERLLKQAGQSVDSTKPILEINPGHMIVQKLHNNLDGEHFSDWSHILLDQAQLAEGGQLEDPATFVKRLNGLMMALSA
ncbi:molecular chaperone HtpG [Chitinivorax sp. B]|uniref:molecular chaperone HtpG n=1 Tax=Chitinivorax sp. B TaxID=2502235 RepID=UPI0010F7C2E8|nr:molecular chaperone HtpG [Chitinivorax sp. B]